MPGRLYSRKGCLRCRVRRKKCDEKRPICDKCRTSGLVCIWRGNDHSAIHVLPASKTLGLMYANLRTHDETCNFVLPNPGLLRQYCPRHAVSPGFISLRNDHEHNLLVNLNGFLDMLALSEQGRNHTHVFRAGLQNLWVRDTLLAFSAFVLSNRAQSLRTKAYEYYSKSVARVQEEILSEQLRENIDNLLITTLFLGLIEVSNPENMVFPLLHFEAVGRLLEMVFKHSIGPKDASQSIFYRVALEAYLYHVSILSLFYPHTDRYSELTPEMDKLATEQSALQGNVIIALNINIYRILFRLTLLGRKDPTYPDFHVRLTEMQALIDEIPQNPSSGTCTTVSAVNGAQFWHLTRTATYAIRIFAMKVRDRQILPSNGAITREVSSAIKELRLCVSQRAWTGNFVWIFTILLCAAHLTTDFEALCTKLEEIKIGLWGADLARMQRVITAVQKRRQGSCELAAGSDGIVEQAQYDTLAMLLHPKGVLA